jgi:hypothetical protein
MGREDVPTRGSEWFVYLEFCVGVIYGIGWFPCGSASSPTVIEGQPTGFGLLYYVHVVRIHIPAPPISSSVRPVIFLMRESSNPSACKFLAVSNFPT